MGMKRLLAPAIVLVLVLGCSSSDDGADGSGVQLPPDSAGMDGTNPPPVQDAVPDPGGTDTPVTDTPGADTPVADTPQGNAGAGGTDTEPMMPPEAMDGPVSLRGLCDLNTRFPGDEACLLPPPEGMGMQIHIGPEDYENPGQYEFGPGRESSECVNFVTPNTEDVFYQLFELSGRAGTHHIINTMYSTPNPGESGQFVTACRDGGLGTNGEIIDNLPGAAKPWMEIGTVAPENAGLGRRIPASTASQADMHYFNPTEEPMLREFWLNIWFKPASDITEEANQIRGMGGVVSWLGGIPVGADIVYDYSCPISAPGRIISLLGHYHSHGVRFSAWINRGRADERKVYEMYDYLEPVAFSYDSITTNPEFSPSAPGAVSGMLDVNAGDTLDWECHIINDLDVPLRYTNEVVAGEMCNMWGASVGPLIDCPLL